MSTMDGDDDTVSDSVATVVIAEPVNESDHVGAASTTQQTNTTIQKKSRFSWSHHGTNPKFVDTYIVHEENYKDERLIRHLMQVCPWKARHGNVKAAWKKVLDGLLLEKIDGTFMFAGINVMTIRNRYQNVYLVLGDKWRKEREQRNVEEASEDEEPENRNERTTKQLIKQGIEDLYEDHIQHEEEVQEQKTNDKEKEEKGKIAATRIKEAALGCLQRWQSTLKVASQRQTRSKTKKNPPKTKGKSASSSSSNSGDGNSSSTANDDEEYVDDKDDSPNEAPDVVETPRTKLTFGQNSSKSSSTSKHKNQSSVDSVVEEVMQQNADRQEKLLEMQQQRLEYKQSKEDRKRKVETNKEKEIELQQQRLEMEKEQHKAAMKAQMAQMEAFSNNAKSTQETNMKMIEFMAMMTKQMGGTDEDEKNSQRRTSPRKK